MKIQVQDMVKRTVRVCDLCKKTTTALTCSGCSIDICDKCSSFWYTDPWSQSDNGDYPDAVCPECSRKSQRFVHEAEELHKEFDKKIEELHARWISACRENRGD